MIIKAGDRVTITAATDGALLWQDVLVEKVYPKRSVDVSTIYVVKTDKGKELKATPLNVAGPLLEGEWNARGSWADCVWRPKAVKL